MFNTYGQENETYDFDVAPQSYDDQEQAAEDDYAMDYDEPQEYELEAQSYSQPIIAPKEKAADKPKITYHDLLLNDRYESRDSGYGGEEEVDEYKEDEYSQDYEEAEEEYDDYRQDDRRQGGYGDRVDEDPYKDEYNLGYNSGFAAGYYAPHPGMGYGARDPYAPQKQRY